MPPRKVGRPKLGKYVMLPLDELIVPTTNELIHSPAQIKSLAAIIKRFGQLKPISIDANKVILAGVGRYMALKLLGRTHARCKYSRNKGIKAEAFRFADNRLAELSRLKMDRVRETVERVRAAGGDLYDPDVLGLDAADLKRIQLGPDFWHGKEVDLPSVATYEQGGETFVIKIENVLLKDSDRIYKRLNKELEQTGYEAIIG